MTSSDMQDSVVRPAVADSVVLVCLWRTFSPSLVISLAVILVDSVVLADSAAEDSVPAM